jgi:predicted  nucleic acid-binding Zn-ribbon protein
MIISPFKIKKLNISSTWVYNVPTNTDCTICRCNLSTPSIYNQEKGMDSYVVSGDCLHSFHQECIKPWVDKNKSCPICSKNWNYSKKPSDDEILSSKNMKNKFKYVDYKTISDISGNLIDYNDYNKKNINKIDTIVKNYIKIEMSMDINGNSINKTITNNINKESMDSSGNIKIIKIVKDVKNEVKDIKDDLKDVKNEVKDVKNEVKDFKDDVKDIKNEVKDIKDEVKDVKYNFLNMKDLWKEKKIEQMKYHYKMKYKDSDNKMDDIFDKEYIDKTSEDYTKDYINSKTKKINIINKSSETTTDIKKLYVDKMITMFKQNVNDISSSPKWDSDSEDNASTDNEEIKTKKSKGNY